MLNELSVFEFYNIILRRQPLHNWLNYLKLTTNAKRTCFVKDASYPAPDQLVQAQLIVAGLQAL